MLDYVIICLNALESAPWNAGATEADSIEEVAAPALYM